ncbi:outer membrane protein assembly factor BamE [Kingella negevensis]|uniref:outer membrane protein assembly factor BamE n=1 Tax=Kingella negevensis TaxID=1522312 RepID=UPI00050A270C|nr:outer membrane protein assembly factor BamE [Kingella negevensis]MDK4689592.1 outer membrane protein assembly factor BamE [Kingella negevensis]WII90438.1 outer membrane protein assembly factor BamE [Kingella negevensis]WII93831.1 outer membrane protein assembly factor BamE [Kingella negevensis]
MLKKLALMLATATVLSACGTSGTVVSSDGTSDKLHWPDPQSTSFNKDRGTFPDLGSLKQIRSGMSKDQLYYLIGRPQFTEGFRVREWDYLFHFNTPGQGTNNVTTCQYKVLFDNQRFARSFHWRPVDPVGAKCPPELEKEVPPPQPQVIIREIVKTPVRIRQ